MIEQTYFDFDPRADSDVKPRWIDGEEFVNYLRRLSKWYAKHPDKCNHACTEYGPHDGKDTAWYERCSDCHTRITQQIRDKFIDF
jgi:hypothetical protein